MSLDPVSYSKLSRALRRYTPPKARAFIWGKTICNLLKFTGRALNQSSRGELLDLPKPSSPDELGFKRRKNRSSPDELWFQSSPDELLDLPKPSSLDELGFKRRKNGVHRTNSDFRVRPMSFWTAQNRVLRTNPVFRELLWKHYKSMKKIFAWAKMATSQKFDKQFQEERFQKATNDEHFVLNILYTWSIWNVNTYMDC